MSPAGRRPNRGRTSSSPRPDLRDQTKLIQEARARLTNAVERESFDRLAADYEDFTAINLELLVRAAQVTGRVEAARALVRRDGMLTPGERGKNLVRHPALLIERAALAELRAILRELRLSETTE